VIASLASTPPPGGRILIDRSRTWPRCTLPSWQQRLGLVSQTRFCFNALAGGEHRLRLRWATRGRCAGRGGAGPRRRALHRRTARRAFDTRWGSGLQLSGRPSASASAWRRAIPAQTEAADPRLKAPVPWNSQSERLVQQAMRSNLSGHSGTVWWIAHRLSTIFL